jgi:hypothetical protein
MLEAAETLEKRYAAIKGVATARKENRPVDPAGHMNYLTSWHQPAVPHPGADEGDAEAGVALPSMKKRKRNEFEESRDAGISLLEWDEDEEFITGIGSRAPVDYAYAPGHHPSNRKKVRKDDRKKAAALNGGVGGDTPIPKKKGRKKQVHPKVAIPPAPTFADGSSITPTDSAAAPRPPLKAKAYAHASSKMKVTSSMVKKPELGVLVMAAKRLAEGRREGREGGIPFGAPFPVGGFVLPYAGNHGEFQLPPSVARRAAAPPEPTGNAEPAKNKHVVEEMAPRKVEPTPLVAEDAVSEEADSAVETQEVPMQPRQQDTVISAAAANILETDDEDLTELSSDDGRAEPDDEDDQDEPQSTRADEDADGEGEEEGEDEAEDDDTDSFRPE